MKEQIEEILNQYIQDMINFQPEYEYGCYERGLYPKSLYERAYYALHNIEWMEQYCEERGVDTSNFNIFLSFQSLFPHAAFYAFQFLFCLPLRKAAWLPHNIFYYLWQAGSISVQHILTCRCRLPL